MAFYRRLPDDELTTLIEALRAGKKSQKELVTELQEKGYQVSRSSMSKFYLRLKKGDVPDPIRPFGVSFGQQMERATLMGTLPALLARHEFRIQLREWRAFTQFMKQLFDEINDVLFQVEDGSVENEKRNQK